MDFPDKIRWKRVPSFICQKAHLSLRDFEIDTLTFVKKYIFTFLTLEYTFWWPWIKYDLEDDLESPKYNYKCFFHLKSHEKKVLHMILALFVKRDIFSYLTL